MTQRIRSTVAKLHGQIATPSDARLAVRIALWTGALRVLKHVVPLPALVRLVRRRPTRDWRWREEQVLVLARWASRVWAWSSRDACLERALVSYRYLSGMGADVRLVFGFSRQERGALKGHAWVAIGRRVVEEDEKALSAFSPAGAFGPDGRLTAVPTF
jgi:Transglutaminase-like superfamily